MSICLEYQFEIAAGVSSASGTQQQCAAAQQVVGY
jgi:hypothetical protein